MVRADPRFLPKFQISKYHDRGRDRLVQLENGTEPYSDLRSIPPSYSYPQTRTQVRRNSRYLFLSLDSRRTRFRMPVKVGTANKWTLIYPTTQWKTDKTDIKKADF